MFSSNYITPRNSQSCYDNTLRPSLSEYNRFSNNETNPQNNMFTQNPLMISQQSNRSNNRGMSGTQQSLGLGNNLINYKQLEISDIYILYLLSMNHTLFLFSFDIYTKKQYLLTQKTDINILHFQHYQIMAQYHY